MIKKFPKGFYLFLYSFIFISACSPYHNNPALALARDFMDAYYVLADHSRAISITQDLALEEIKKEMDLLKGIPSREDYRTRDVSFSINQFNETDTQLNVLFDVKIHIPNLDERNLKIAVIVEKKTMKVSHFAEVK